MAFRETLEAEWSQHEKRLHELSASLQAAETSLEIAQKTAVEARAELMKERTRFDVVEEKLSRE